MSLLTIACRQRGMIVFVFIIFTVAFVGDCRFSSNAYWLTCVFPAAAHFHIAQAASENTNDREGVAGTRPTMESQLDPKSTQWYKITFDPSKLASDVAGQIAGTFINRSLRAGGTPRGAGLFWSQELVFPLDARVPTIWQPLDTRVTIYFSPLAAVFCQDVLKSYSAEQCDRPDPNLRLDCFVGHPDSLLSLRDKPRSERRQRKTTRSPSSR